MSNTNLNKLLCKHFDKDGNGVVTVGDVLDGIIWKSVPFILAALYIHGAISLYKMAHVWAPDYTPPLAPLAVAGIIMFVLGTIFLTTVAGYYFISSVLDTRIATCERKDGD